MATIEENLKTLIATKATIKKAIEEKGVSVGDIPFSEYANKIENIVTSEFPIRVIRNDVECYINYKEGNSISRMFSEAQQITIKDGVSLLGAANATFAFQNIRMEEFVAPPLRAQDYGNCFQNCPNLKKLDIHNVDFSNAQSLYAMLADNPKMEELTIGTVDMSNVGNATYFLSGSSALTSIKVAEGYEGFKNVHINLNLSSCPLDQDSILMIIKGLDDVTALGTRTLSVNSVTKGYLSNDVISEINNKGWTLG